MQPFTTNYRQSADSRIDLSFLLDRPAGRDGFVTIKDGRLVKPDGARLRLWGVNITDWSPGAVMLPSKQDAPLFAAILARYGINCVRLHFLDLPAPRGLIDPTRDDTQHFDRDQIDRLDFWVATLKAEGIYCDLNLVVGRSYKAGDRVRDYEQIGWAKGLTYFDPRLIELQKAYAAQLLTHYNPYTQCEYRHEPAIVIIELVNENSLVEAWHLGRLHPRDPEGDDPNFRPITAYYAQLLTGMYQEYIGQLAPAARDRLRAAAGVPEDAIVPRLRPEEFATAAGERFQIEAAFYMQLERGYFTEMQTFLRHELGVKSLLIGSNDHVHSRSGYPIVWTNSALDIVDGHVYWQHPAHREGENTPMVNEPLASTVVKLSRTALAGRPYTVSEANHLFPNEWASEGIPILAAYASFQDWDAVMWYTIEFQADPDWQPYVVDAFDLSSDPVRMSQLAVGALLFLRGDVSAAQRLVERSYTLEQVRDSLRLASEEKPYYTPDFPVALVLQHKVRIGSLDGPATAPVTTIESNPIISDTGELKWYTTPSRRGLVTIDTPRSQGVIGFVDSSVGSVRHLDVDVTNLFCAITLSALDGEPIASSARLLLTAGASVGNTGQRWNESRTAVIEHGCSPSLIEPVCGRIILRDVEAATAVLVQALDGAGRPIGGARAAQATSEGWEILIGDPVTTWYELTINRR
ncbi:MAG TPA: hypothetical protein VGD69_30825 [Herpetosiphonaceae bacterium]